METVSHQFSSQSGEMLVAGNMCNYIKLSKEPPGLEEASVIWESVALWVVKR